MHSIIVIWLNLQVTERTDCFLRMPKLQSIELGRFVFSGDCNNDYVWEGDIHEGYHCTITMKGEMHGSITTNRSSFPDFIQGGLFRL